MPSTGYSQICKFVTRKYFAPGILSMDSITLENPEAEFYAQVINVFSSELHDATLKDASHEKPCQAFESSKLSRQQTFPKNPLAHIYDDQSEEQVGYSFLTDDRNAWMRQGA